MLSQLTYGLTHIPEVIIPLFQSVGNWGYLLSLLITFMETGLVVFPLAARRVLDFCGDLAIGRFDQPNPH